ncbi:MAG: PD-(D/E)XK nuclease family protein [Chloroflexota bacterium]|nr:PD-(D/E)XK nuclease family protein [Chloroflexota bacterium]
MPDSARQLPLFANDHPSVPEKRAARLHPTWSFSRRSLLERCPRAYYLQFYGSNARSARGEPLKEELRRLKTLVSRHERAGKLLHLGASTYFRHARRGDLWEAEQLVEWITDIFREDCAYSRTHPRGGGEVAGREHQPALLWEYFDGHPDADRLCEEAAARLADGVRRFATDPGFEEFRLNGTLIGALVEHRFTLAGMPFPAAGVVDLAYVSAGKVTVVDWKLGEYDGCGDGSLQLATYALWATEYYRCAPGDVRVCEVHPAYGEVVEHAATTSLLAAARARITQDVERMGLLHPYGRDAVGGAFTKRLAPAICNLCRYKSVCLDPEEFRP